MRLMMRGHTFSPLYWKRMHCSLVDLVRQAPNFPPGSLHDRKVKPRGWQAAKALSPMRTKERLEFFDSSSEPTHSRGLLRDRADS